MPIYDMRDDFRGQMALSSSIGQGIGSAIGGYQRSKQQAEQKAMLDAKLADEQNARRETIRILADSNMDARQRREALLQVKNIEKTEIGQTFANESVRQMFPGTSKQQGYSVAPWYLDPKHKGSPDAAAARKAINDGKASQVTPSVLLDAITNYDTPEDIRQIAVRQYKELFGAIPKSGTGIDIRHEGGIANAQNPEMMSGIDERPTAPPPPIHKTPFDGKGKAFDLGENVPGSKGFNEKVDQLPVEVRTPDTNVIDYWIGVSHSELGAGATDEQILKRAKERAQSYGWIVK